MLLTESEKKRIETAIAEAEKKTSGEIVVTALESSHSYLWVHGAWALLGWAVVSIAFLIQEKASWSNLSLPNLFAWQLFGIGLGALVPMIDSVKRWCIPFSWRVREVSRRAGAAFHELGLSRTRDRTGILILLSELEHRVVILADEGIDQKVEKGYWQDSVDAIIAGIRSKQLCDSLCQVVEKLGEKLAESFPPREDDQNELSNRVNMEERS